MKSPHENAYGVLGAAKSIRCARQLSEAGFGRFTVEISAGLIFQIRLVIMPTQHFILTTLPAWRHALSIIMPYRTRCPRKFVPEHRTN